MLFMKPGDGEGIDTDALSKLLEGYTNKHEFNDLKERVEKLEKEFTDLDEKSEKHSKKLTNHKDKIKNHTEEINELKKKKVGSDTFDSEINFIKNLLNKHSGDKIDLSSMGPQFNSTEVQKLKLMIDQFPLVEKDVEKILNDLKHIDLGRLKDHLAHLEDLINQKADRVELGPIKDEINKINDLLKRLQVEIAAAKATAGSGTNINGDVLVEITNRIDKIELRLDGLDKKLANLSR